MNTPALQLERGFYCECYINARRLGSYDAYSTHEALRWIRTSLMMVAITLDEEPYQQARHWLDHGQTEAAPTLAEGQPHTLTLKQRTTEASWTIRPVIYLPLHARNTSAHQERA